MLLLLSSSLFISLSISLILASSPLSMGLWVLLIALASAFFVGVLFNSWFSFIIFLIYIGGMLVMFAYFAALTPNQPLGISSMFILSFISLLILLSVFSLSLPSPSSLLSSMFMPNSLSSTSILYSPSNSNILLLLASILFFALVAVVKVANISKGPLRPFN